MEVLTIYLSLLAPIKLPISRVPVEGMAVAKFEPEPTIFSIQAQRFSFNRASPVQLSLRKHVKPLEIHPLPASRSRLEVR
jgi:hypothetical protein